MTAPQPPSSQPRHHYASIAELDDAVAAGHVPFNRYWDIREELERHELQRSEEHRYDLDGAAGRAHPVVDTRFVAPPPVPVHRRDGAPRPQQPMVPPPPPAVGPVQPVRLPVAGPSADAGPTRARDRRRRRRSGPR